MARRTAIQLYAGDVGGGSIWAGAGLYLEGGMSQERLAACTMERKGWVPVVATGLAR